ncbi:MAG: signal peptide peptidase SppA [Flavobacteriales bacterium]|nr:signal peptide peptidase SppA [Flavobacteriales bacterium]
MNFWKTLLASLIGSFVAFGLVMLIFILIVVAAIGGAMSSATSGGGGAAVSVKENSVLHIEMDSPIVERGNENEFNFNPATFESETSIGLNHFVKDLEKAKGDDRIKGIFLEVKNFSCAPSTLLDLHNALEAFKSSGKWIVAYGENYTQGGYYLASVADEVHLNPEGMFDWRGLNAESIFFKKMLDKLGIEAQIIRGPDNKFKSAVEPFMLESMSDANRQQLKTFIDDIWNVMLGHISASRNVTINELNAYADSLVFIQNEKALNAKLLDALSYQDQVMDILKERSGVASDSTTTARDENSSDSKLRMVSLSDYHNAKVKRTNEDESTPDFKKEKIAVVYAVGDIMSGEGDDQTIGSDRIAKALRDAREDEKVKAIVLRVNSPGGSALASEVIWRETQLIKESGKPLVVSMGDYAASGGYYIACSADKIFANPNTITGSIGVFGIVPNMQKFWDEKVGITFDRYETNPHADMISTNKPLDQKEMEAFQTMVTDIYDSFITHVSEGRGIEKATVDSLGQGRVWSGEDALAIGLVDELGNLQDAIEAAAEMAQLTDYATRELPELIDPFKELINDLMGQKQTAILKSSLGENFTLYQFIDYVAKMKGVQARLPFIIKIE